MLCKCGYPLKNNDYAYSYLKEIDKNSLIIVPDAVSKTIKVLESSREKELSLHTCQSEDFNQLCAIRSLDPLSRITLINGPDSITLYACYEKWNYVIKCVALENV